MGWSLGWLLRQRASNWRRSKAGTLSPGSRGFHVFLGKAVHNQLSPCRSGLNKSSGAPRQRQAQARRGLNALWPRRAGPAAPNRCSCGPSQGWHLRRPLIRIWASTQVRIAPPPAPPKRIATLSGHPEAFWPVTEVGRCLPQARTGFRGPWVAVRAISLSSTSATSKLMVMTAAECSTSTTRTCRATGSSAPHSARAHAVTT